jgi:hypothetical protein
VEKRHIDAPLLLHGATTFTYSCMVYARRVTYMPSGRLSVYVQPAQRLQDIMNALRSNWADPINLGCLSIIPHEA